MVMEWGYLDMSIPTIKHDNLNRYGRILTTNPESRRKICTSIYITNSLLIGQGPRDRQGKKRKVYGEKYSCNT